MPPPVMSGSGMPDGMAALRMKQPKMPPLPAGLTQEEFQNLPPEQQLIIQQQMMQAKAVQERTALEDMNFD